jgi:YVTN family beta-propeller protein
MQMCRILAIACVLLCASHPAWAAPFAYVANGMSNSISVIDTETNVVTATVAAGQGPQGIAVSPDESRVYVASVGTARLLTMDAATNSIVGSLSVGRGPVGVVLSADGRWIYVSNNGSNSVSVIDAGSSTLSATIGVGTNPHIGLALTPDQRHLYVPNSMGGGSVSVIETSSNTVSTSIDLGGNPVGIAVVPDGSRAYVANAGNSSVPVIDVSSQRVIESVPVLHPLGIAASPTGPWIYVTDLASDSLLVIDTRTNAVVAGVAVEQDPYFVAVTPDGKKLYVANNTSNSVSAIDAATLTVEATVPVGNSPGAIGIVSVPPVRTVHIDVRPGSTDNEINRKAKGPLPVAIFSSADFDATLVDVGSVTLAAAPVRRKGNGTFSTEIEDVNGDGWPDLIVQIDNQMLDLPDGSVEARLVGRTTSGVRFAGTDSIRLLP